MAQLHYLIVGGCGFIGYHLSRRLLFNGHRVTAIDDLSSPGSEANHEELRGWGLFRSIVGDCRNSELWRLPMMPKPWEVTRCVFLAETDGTQRRLALQEAGVGTLASWASKARRPKKSRAPRVLVVTPPECHAGVDKAIEASAGSGLEFRVVELFECYGPRMPARAVLRQMVRNLIEGRDIRLPEHGRQVRTLLHVEDAAVALFKAVDKAHLPLRLQIGGWNEWRTIDIALMLGRRIPSQAQIVPTDRRNGTPSRYVQKSNEAYKVLSWEPRLRVPATVSHLIRWEQDGTDLTAKDYEED